MHSQVNGEQGRRVRDLRTGSAMETVRYFLQQGLLFPRRLRIGPNKGDLLWAPVREVVEIEAGDVVSAIAGASRRAGESDAPR